MIDFGFKLSRSSTIDLDKVEMGLYRKLCELEPDARRCMECGSCGAVCTASPFSGMSLRKVIHGIQRGEDVRPMLRGCMLCGKCNIVCPRGINTRHLVLSLCRIYGQGDGD